MLRRLAKIYSYAMHPFLIPIYVMVVLLFCPTVYSYYPFKGKLYLLWVVTLFSLILPILTITLVKRFSRLYFRHLTRKQFYVMSILICSICYLLCAITFMGVPSLLIFRKMIVVGGYTPLHYTSEGIIEVGAIPFLLDASILDKALAD